MELEYEYKSSRERLLTYLQVFTMDAHHPQTPTPVGVSPSPFSHHLAYYHPYVYPYTMSRAPQGSAPLGNLTYPFHAFPAAGTAFTGLQQYSTPSAGPNTGSRTPLCDQMSSTVNNVPQTGNSQPGNSRKRRQTTAASTRSKQGTSNSNLAFTPAIPGAGPQTQLEVTPSAVHPALPRPPQDPFVFESILPTGTHAPGNEATDVWFFVRGLETASKPLVAPAREPLSRRQPDPKKYPVILCRLCR